MMMNAGPVPMFSQVIESRRDFDRLIRGYERLRAISYVVSLDLLLQLFQTYGFEQVEVLVGENLSGSSLADRYKRTEGCVSWCRAAASTPNCTYWVVRAPIG